MKLSQFIDNHILKKDYQFDSQTSKEIYDFFHATHPNNLLEFIKLLPQDMLKQINNSYEYKTFVNNSYNEQYNSSKSNNQTNNQTNNYANINAYNNGSNNYTTHENLDKKLNQSLTLNQNQQTNQKQNRGINKEPISTTQHNKKYTYSNLKKSTVTNNTGNSQGSNISSTTNAGDTKKINNKNNITYLNCSSLSDPKYHFWNKNDTLGEILKGFMNNIEINPTYLLSNDLYTPNIYTLTKILATYDISNTLELYNALFLELLLENTTLSFTNLYKQCKANSSFRKSIIYLPIPIYLITNHNQCELLNTSSAMIVFRYICRNLPFKNDVFLSQYQDINNVIPSPVAQKVFKKRIFEYLDKINISYINIIKLLEPSKPENTCTNINCTLSRSKTYRFALTLLKLKQENSSPQNFNYTTSLPNMQSNMNSSLEDEYDDCYEYEDTNEYECNHNNENEYDGDEYYEDEFDNQKSNINSSNILSSTLFKTNITKNKINRGKDHVKSFRLSKLSINSLKHATIILDAYFKFINSTTHNTTNFYCEAYIGAVEFFYQLKKFGQYMNINLNDKQEKIMINTIFNLVTQLNQNNKEQLTENYSSSGMPYYIFKEMVDMPIYQDYLHDEVPKPIMKELINLRFHRS